MDHSEFYNMLDRYSQLSDAELARLEAHAAECEDCRRELEFFKSINETVSSLKAPSPPPDLADRINSAIDELPKPGLIRAAADNIRSNIRQYAAAAACLAIGIIVGANGAMISERLSGGDNDGVIRTETVVNGDGVTASDDGSETPKEDTPAAPAADAPADTRGNTDQSAQPGAAEDRNNTADTAPAVTPAAPAAAASGGGSSAQSGSGTRTAPASSVSPATVTEAPRSAAEQPKTAARDEQADRIRPAAEQELPQAPAESAQVSADDETDTYTIAQDTYHLPDTYAAVPSADPTEGEVESYALAQDTGSEVGYADTAVTPDKLVVYAADSDEFMAIMGRFNVVSSSTANRMTSGDFFTLLATLDAEGVNYSYVTRGSSDEYVSFIVVLL